MAEHQSNGKAIATTGGTVHRLVTSNFPTEQMAARYRAFVAAAQDMELALLGAVLHNADAFDLAAPHVSVADFTDPLFGVVWKSLGDMVEAGIRPTAPLLSARLSAPELVETIRESYGCRPIELIIRMSEHATTVSGAPDYAKTVREFRHRRDLHAEGEKLQDMMWDPSQSFLEATSRAAEAIEVALNAGQAPRRSLKENIQDSLATLALDYVAPGFTTGLDDVDALMGGFVPGDLVVVGARPSMGKSTFSLSVSLASAKASHRRVIQEEDGDPWGVLVLTTEMTHIQCTQRMLTDIAYDLCDWRDPVTYQRFRPAPGKTPPRLTRTQSDALEHAAHLLPRLPIVVDGRPGMTITEVTATIRKHKKAFAKRGIPLRVVVVDHIGLGKILAVRVKHNPILELGEITSSLKATAVNEDLCVVACHQLSRANEGNENKRPQLQHFRDSGHIEQDADVMVGLYRHAYYLERNKESDHGKEELRLAELDTQKHEMEAFILKNRQGPVGLVNLFASMGANAVRNKGTQRQSAY
jgi:replicative DNA helicase